MTAGNINRDIFVETAMLAGEHRTGSSFDRQAMSMDMDLSGLFRVFRNILGAMANSF